MVWLLGGEGRRVKRDDNKMFVNFLRHVYIRRDNARYFVANFDSFFLFFLLLPCLLLRSERKKESSWVRFASSHSPRFSV